MMKKLLCTIVLILATVGFVQAQQEIDVLGNAISIIGDGTNTPNVADDTDFGQVTTGTASVEHIFTIQNTGTSPLTVNPSFTTNPIFDITTDAISPVPAGGSTTIGVTFTAPATVGIYNAILVIFNDDADEGVYQINIQGESIAPVGPEIDVLGNGISIIGDGTNTPIIGDDTDYGQITTGLSIEHIFTIQNTGSTALTVNPSFLSNDPIFEITTAAVSPVAPGGSTTIGVTFNAPLTLGINTAILVISNSDSDENPYQINIQGESVAPVGPEIDVLGNAISIIGDGSNTPNVADDTDFGQVTTGTNSVEHIFTIQNTGTSPLTVNPSFTTDPIFDITTDAISPIPAGGSTTIGVTFIAPAIVGTYNAVLVIFNDDSDENPYQINIQGESIAPVGPEIDVLGNAISIIGDGTNTPSVTDDTDYGQIATGTPVEHIFTIQNTGTSPLTVNPSFIAGSTDFTITTAAVSPVSVGGTTTIGVTYNSPDIGVDTATIFITNDDSDENPYQINIQGEAIASEPEIDILGNGISIVGDGTNIPNVTDDTSFGQVDVTSGSVTHIFTIENTGVSDLNLTGAPLVDVLGANPADFTVVVVPTSPVAASGSTTFSITFDPSALGVRTAIVSIANDDSDENPYIFNIQGEGIDINASTPLLITQYYEGIGSNQWIEVKNVSTNTVIAGSYFLALYQDSNTLDGTINTTAPQQSVAIGTMAPGEVRVFRNSSATLPSAGNLGSGIITDSNVCLFDGDDVILISTTITNTCYDNRIDIMGIVEPSTGIPPVWGADKGFIKGCGTTESPVTTFDAIINGDGSVTVNDYIELTIDEVNNAISSTNIALGTQGSITTTWTTSWNDGEPDRTRNAIINGVYVASTGSIESCNLIISGSGSLDFSGSTTNYIAVNEDLTISGTLTLGDAASLYTVDAINPANTGAITGSITKFETTTTLADLNDFTYWSSPVQGASVNTVFAANNLDRIFYWDQSVTNTIPGGGTEILGEWLQAMGQTMTSGKGYIAEGPPGGTYPLQQTISFTGAPNNATITLTNSNNDVVFNNEGNTENDYVVVGNPYPSAIFADNFINDADNLVNIDGTIWFWTHNTPANTDPVNRYTTADYATYNLSGSLAGAPAASGGATPTGNIGSGQGFVVRTISISERVEFNNAMRLKNSNTQFFRGIDSKNSVIEEKDRIWLNLESTDGGAFNQILVGFFDKATDEYDRGYDGLRNSANWINFYSKIDTLKYGIQGLSNFNIDKKIPLGFDTFIDEALTYKISIHKIEGVLKDNDVYLVDNNLNITHDLKLADYEFDVDGKGNFTDRFTLQFTKSTLGVGDLELDGNSFVIINEESSFRLKSNTEIKRLKVYDMMGRLLIDKNPNESEFTISTHNIRKGTVLILNATFDNGAEVSKKAIKY